jgi:predicted double-glycine peptidase
MPTNEEVPIPFENVAVTAFLYSTAKTVGVNARVHGGSVEEPGAIFDGILRAMRSPGNRAYFIEEVQKYLSATEAEIEAIVQETP